MPSEIFPPAIEGVRAADKLLLAVLSFQRQRQLQAGARPRVERARHGTPRLAYLEVSQGLVSWECDAVAEAPKQSTTE